MAINKKIWDQVKVLFEGDVVPQKIADKFGINRSSIVKKAAKDGWIKGKNIGLINDDARVTAKKAQLNSQELEFHNTEVNRLSKDQIMIHSLTKNNLIGVAAKLENHGDLDMMGHKNAQDLIDKASITLGVSPRHANSQVNFNNTNAQQNNVPKDFNEFYE